MAIDITDIIIFVKMSSVLQSRLFTNYTQLMFFINFSNLLYNPPV